MKRYKYFLLFLLFLTSCKFSFDTGMNAYTMKENKDIDPAIKNEINSYNKNIINSILMNNPNVMHKMFIKEVQDKGLGSTANYYNQIKHFIKDTKFINQNDLHIKLKGIGRKNVIIPKNEFLINIPVFGDEIFITLIEKNYDVFIDMLITYVYCKRDNKWQLQAYHIGNYRIAGKTTKQWHNDINELYKKDYVFPAVMLALGFEDNMLRPAPFIMYDKEKEFVNLLTKIKNDSRIKINFPLIIDEIKTKPAIYGYKGNFIKRDFVPAIRYYSLIFNSSKNELQSEVDQITSVIDKYMPGFTQTSDTILYQVCSKPPIAGNFSTKGMVSKIKKSAKN